MKIIQLTYALGSGGAERVVIDLSNELARRGHQVVVCAILDLNINPIFSFNLASLSSNIRYVNLHQLEGFHFSKLKVIQDFILQEKPDVVHCHLNNLPYIFNLAYSHREIRFVYTLHNIATKASGPKYQYPLNKFFFKRNLIIPVSISTVCQKSYEDLYNLNNSVCIANGRAKLSPSSSYKEVEKRINGLKKSSNTKVFVHVARFDEQKNQDLLIDAFNVLHRDNIDFLLIVVGADFDSPQAKPLRERACDRIVFEGVKSNVADYLLCSQAFCLTSKYEGLPISLLEAISCGCIPICTPVGGIPDVIVDGKNGYLSEDLSLEKYVKKLRSFIEGNAIRSGDLILEFEENYSIEVTVDKYLQIYQK